MAEIRYVILIGVNDYDFAPLSFCVKDVADIKDCFINYCNVDVSNVFSITSADNSPSEDIIGSLEKILLRIESKFQKHEDSIFIYYSGHGSRSNDSTTLVLKNKKITLQELFSRLSKLNPKFVLFLIDSCFSGVGISDEIGKSSDDLFFSQLLKEVSGFNIFCASAADKTAKEDSNFQNGRFTKFFIDTVKNKLNYHNDILYLSKVYQKIDLLFKEMPELRQLPWSQTRGLSTYPLAYSNDKNKENYYSAHYISDIENYDWENFKYELSHYVSLQQELIVDFTRLIREILRNSSHWGKATFLKIEITSGGIVNIIENSQKYFNIFYPPEKTQLHGGGITAKRFLEKYDQLYTYSYSVTSNGIIQSFHFITLNENSDNCIKYINNTRQMSKYNALAEFTIPPECNELKIYIPSGYLDLSTIHGFLRSVINSSKKENKKVTIVIDDKDTLKPEFISALSWCEDLRPHSVTLI